MRRGPVAPAPSKSGTGGPEERPMRLPGPPEGPVFPSLPTDRPIGHPHFWDRVISRRDVLAGAAGATGLLATSGVWAPVLARRASSDPKPIPGVVAPGAPFHVNLPGHG